MPSRAKASRPDRRYEKEVLTYGEVPDMKLNDPTSRLFYGRTSS